MNHFFPLFKLLLLFFLFNFSAISAKEVRDAIQISSRASSLLPGKQIRYLEDKKGEITLEEIIGGMHEEKFQSGTHDTFNFGYTRSTYWLHFSLENKENRENHQFLEVEFPNLDYVHAYIREYNQIVVWETGDMHPFSKRAIEHKNFLFPLDFAKKETKEVYLRIRTDSTTIIPINIWRVEDMLRRDLIDNFLYGIIMGITIVMISYNVFLFRTFREKLFIFFITHSLFTLIFLLSLSGFLYQFIFSNSPILSNRILIVSINGLVCMGSFFGRDFLNLKNTHSGLFRISNWIIGGLLISFAISFGLSYMIATILISVLGIISFFFFTFVSIYLYIFRYEKVISLYFFLINLFITFAGGVVFSSNLGWLDRNFFTTYGFLMAIPFQMIVFSIGISYRVNILKKEKHEIEKWSEETRMKLNSIQSEIETAGRIHKSILPDGSPKIDGLEIHSTYLPSNEIGGDFYDFWTTEDGQLGVFIADVTGHGIPAALFASIVKYSFSRGARFSHEPDKLLSFVNTSLYKKLGNQFLTAGYLLIDPKKRILKYSSCGHPPIMIFRAETGNLEEFKPRGRMVGVFPEIELEVKKISVQSGDRILLYTDGLTEASNSKEEYFGENGILEIFKKFQGSNAKETAEEILRAVSEHTGTGGSFDDDVTFLLIDVL